MPPLLQWPDLTAGDRCTIVTPMNTYYNVWGQPARFGTEPPPTPWGDELATPPGVSDTFPVDRWVCERCSVVGLGWISARETCGQYLKWVTTFEVDGEFWCEECAVGAAYEGPP